jgi:hypothetical protein
MKLGNQPTKLLVFDVIYITMAMIFDPDRVLRLLRLGGTKYIADENTSIRPESKLVGQTVSCFMTAFLCIGYAESFQT